MPPALLPETRPESRLLRRCATDLPLTSRTAITLECKAARVDSNTCFDAHPFRERLLPRLRMTGKRDAYHQTRRNQTVGGRGSRLKAAQGFAGQQTESRIESGPFKATRESLKLTHSEWYRDAKFGIWAHWGPQSAAEYGDWYARRMYIEGEWQYKLTSNLWPSVDVWFQGCDPNLEGRQVRSGISGWSLQAGQARNTLSAWVCITTTSVSELETHAWNSVRMGPKKDIVGLFRKAA